MPDASLEVDLAGVPLRTPIMLAAGTAGVLDEMHDVLDLSTVGGVVTKSITPQPREGNASPRITWTRAGMLNAIGLANVGLDAFIEHIAPRIPATPTTVVGSIAGFSIDDYIKVAAAFDDLDAMPAVELNVSCPNVHGGVEFGADAKALAQLITAVRPVLANTRLFVKLPPSTHNIVALAKAAIEPDGSCPAGPNSRPGADALCLCNTTPAMGIDVRTREPVLSNIYGGLSGPAVHPIVTRLIHQTHTAIASDTQTPIIGIGGVLNWEDAAEFVLAGASAVEMGAALFANPKHARRVTRGLTKWVKSQGANNVAELVGTVRA